MKILCIAVEFFPRRNVYWSTRCYSATESTIIDQKADLRGQND